MPNIDCGWLYVIDWFVYYVYALITTDLSICICIDRKLIHRYVYALIALTDSYIMCMHWLHLLIRILCICIDCINWFIDMYMHWSHWPICVLCVCIDRIDRFGYYVYALIAFTNSDIMYMHWSYWLIRILLIYAD